MTLYEETRRTVGCKRASEMSPPGDKTETRPSTLHFQSAWLAARFSMGEAHARVVAEHAFARRPQR